MIKVQNGEATRDPLPAFLVGLAPESLHDLSWTDPALGVSDAAWWPEESESGPLPFGYKWGEEVLTPDSERNVVVSSREPVPLEGQELTDFMEGEKQRLTEAATAKRWQVMTGGLTLPGGIQVGTEIDDQNRITSVVANHELAGLTDESVVSFKATSGFVKITIAQLKQIAGTIGQFVQACYAAEEAHYDAIALLTTVQDVNRYDVNANWPSNGEVTP